MSQAEDDHDGCLTLDMDVIPKRLCVFLGRLYDDNLAWTWSKRLNSESLRLCLVYNTKGVMKGIIRRAFDLGNDLMVFVLKASTLGSALNGIQNTHILQTEHSHPEICTMHNSSARLRSQHCNQKRALAATRTWRPKLSISTTCHEYSTKFKVIVISRTAPAVHQDPFFLGHLVWRSTSPIRMEQPLRGSPKSTSTLEGIAT